MVSREVTAAQTLKNVQLWKRNCKDHRLIYRGLTTFYCDVTVVSVPEIYTFLAKQLRPFTVTYWDLTVYHG